MANIPNNVNSSYNALVEQKVLTTTETVYNTYNSRKFSDYVVLFFTIIIENYIRESVIIPRSVFSGYSETGTSLNYTTGGVTVEIVAKYNTDTSVKMKYNAASNKNVTVRIDALALENKA